MGQSGSDFDGQVVARPDRHLRQDGNSDFSRRHNTDDLNSRLISQTPLSCFLN